MAPPGLVPPIAAALHPPAEVRAVDELHTGDLQIDEPPFLSKQQVNVALEKCMLQLSISNVSEVCCKCFIWVLQK